MVVKLDYLETSEPTWPPPKELCASSELIFPMKGSLCIWEEEAAYTWVA
jgi:hypothetical protein